MLNTRILLLQAAFAGVLISCGPTLKVSSDYDRSADFGKYKTFSMYKTENSSISQLNQDRITNAIIAEMVKKGFQQASTDPDLLVNTVAILKDKVDVSSTTNNYGYGGYYRPYSWGAGMGTSYTSDDVQHYKDGSLIIDIVEAKTKKLLWQGIGNNRIDGPVSDAGTRIPVAIGKIMAGFPPGKAN